MYTCTVDRAARRFVLGFGAGAVPPTRPPTPRLVCRIDRAAVSVATVVQYATQRGLDLDDALRSSVLRRAYYACQPDVPCAVYRRTVYLWRWALAHPEWDARTDPYVVIAPDGEYRWANQAAADLLGFADAGALLERGRAGWQDPAERAMQETLIRVAQAGPVAWRLPGATGQDVQLAAEPLHDDEGEAVAILARFTRQVAPTLPLLPIEVHPAPGARTPAPRVLVHA